MSQHTSEEPPGGASATAQEATPGDTIEARGIPGAPTRRGVITEVIGEGVHRHYRVRWDEEHESLFFPSAQEGVRIIPHPPHEH